MPSKTHPTGKKMAQFAAKPTTIYPTKTVISVQGSTSVVPTTETQDEANYFST